MDRHGPLHVDRPCHTIRAPRQRSTGRGSKKYGRRLELEQNRECIHALRTVHSDDWQLLAVERGDSPFQKTRHTLGAGLSLSGHPVPPFGAVTAPLSRLIFTGPRKEAHTASRDGAVRTSTFTRTIPANVWRQTAEATKPTAVFRNPSLASTQTTVVRQEDHKARIANHRGRSSLQRARIPLRIDRKSLESQP